MAGEAQSGVQTIDNPAARMIATAAGVAATNVVRALINEGVLHANKPEDEDPMLRIKPGPLISYYNDLASGVLKPEDMRIEALEYRVQIDATGQVTFQTDARQLVSSYTFTPRRIYGFALDPATTGSAPALVSFNLREQGRNFDYFKAPVSLGDMVGPGGTTNPMIWDGTYINVPGTQLAVNWSVDSTRWPLLVGTFKEFGVKILGDYVSCRSWT